MVVAGRHAIARTGRFARRRRSESAGAGRADSTRPLRSWRDPADHELVAGRPPATTATRRVPSRETRKQRTFSPVIPGTSSSVTLSP